VVRGLAADAGDGGRRGQNPERREDEGRNIRRRRRNERCAEHEADRENNKQSTSAQPNHRHGFYLMVASAIASVMKRPGGEGRLATYQPFDGAAWIWRQNPYESAHRTNVPAAQPHASGPSPTAKCAMSAEPSVIANPA